MADIVEELSLDGDLTPELSLNGNINATAVVYEKVPATTTELGMIIVGSNLTITSTGVLSVDTANVVEQDNTKPVTSAAVHTEIGNIEALLAAL